MDFKAQTSLQPPSYLTANVQEQSPASDTQHNVAICSLVSSLSHSVLPTSPHKLPRCPFLYSTLHRHPSRKGEARHFEVGSSCCAILPLLFFAHCHSFCSTKLLTNCPEGYPGIFQSSAVYCSDYLKSYHP